jgi:hypothetical protein
MVDLARRSSLPPLLSKQIFPNLHREVAQPPSLRVIEEVEFLIVICRKRN